MNAKDPHNPRVLVGAASYSDAIAALRIVELLPETFRADLGGVLVEEVDILAACQIPDQRIVLIDGTTTLAPSLSQVHTLITADARAFQNSLASMTKSPEASWVFAQDKGALVDTVLKAALGWDILVIGYRQIHNIPGKVVVLKSATIPSDELDETSNQLSKRLAADQIVFIIGEGRASDSTLSFATLDDALKKLARMNAQVVLLDLTHGPVYTLDDLAQVLEHARCPLILTGMSGMTALLENNTIIPPAKDGTEGQQ